jgi:hypothetical protein
MEKIKVLKISKDIFMVLILNNSFMGFQLKDLNSKILTVLTLWSLCTII